ncbi:MAG: hypothetical protein QW655_03410 [Nitrososphaerota archaeon]|nr:hypothetical protein [Candidatus Geocrenenecus dongiae]
MPLNIKKDRFKLEEIIRKTIEEYNKYRGSVARARLIELGEDVVTIEISGTLCHTCGFIDYLEDFVYELERITDDYRAKLKNYKQIDDERIIIEYTVEEKK